MRYGRAINQGSSFFFTVVTEQRRPLFADVKDIDLLREAFRNVKNKQPFDIDAIVIMPDHIHCIWTLPPDDLDFSTRWRLIKTWFSKNYEEDTNFMRNQSRRSKGEKAIWQRRFWEHVIRDEKDYNQHLEYIHYNPVKHGFVAAPKDWLHGSFHRYVRNGIFPVDWGAGYKDIDGIGNE